MARVTTSASEPDAARSFSASATVRALNPGGLLSARRKAAGSSSLPGPAGAMTETRS